MDEPRVGGTSPIECQLEQGKKYAWCSCGHSENQPYCDGNHKGTGMVPLVFEADENQTVYFCTCKKTCSQPYCDGSHNSIDPVDTGG